MGRKNDRLSLLRAGQLPLAATRHHVSRASASVLAAYAVAVSLTAPSMGKTPGEVHCYNGICHRVKTVSEMQALVGMESESLTSYYDVADRDRMNVGAITSSGEEFDADSESHAASSFYPDGTELLIWNPKNRRAAHVRVNDFGPFYMLRTVDVTRGVAEKLDFVKTGIAKLRIVVIWAPGPEDARFRRRRSYPAVEGYLGAVDADQLTGLKSRLIATAAARNGHADVLAAADPGVPPVPRYSLDWLPAYASGDAGNAPARRMAAMLNAPRPLLPDHGPTHVVKSPVAPLVALSAKTIARALPTPAPRAIATPIQPAETVVAARDVEVDASVASQVAIATAAPAAPNLGGAVTEVAALTLTPMPSANTVARSTVLDTSRVWTPGPLLWQQVLALLGVLTLTAIVLRRRAASCQARGTTKAARHAAAAGFAGAVSAPLTCPPPPVASSMDGLRDQAFAAMERHAYVEAEGAYRQLLAERTQAFGSTDPMAASAQRQLADCLREQGRYAAAEPHYRRALTAMAAAAGEMHPATADILDEYATALLRQGHGNRAEILARQALAIRRVTAPRGRELAVTLSIVAETLRAQGQLVAAEIEHRTAWAHFIAVSGKDSSDVAASTTSLGALMGDLGRYAAAEDLLNSGTRTLTARCGPDHPITASGYALLGDLYRRAGALDHAKAMHAHALAIRERVLGQRHPDTVESVLVLAAIATEQFREDDGRCLHERALGTLNTSERPHLGPQSRLRGMLVALSRQYEAMPAAAMAAE